MFKVNDINDMSVRSNLLCQALLWTKLLEKQSLDNEQSIQQITTSKPDVSLLYLKVNLNINF